VNDDDWIIVTNWDRYQDYKGWTPVFLKLWTEVSHQQHFRRSSASDRGHLVTIWLEFGAAVGQIQVRTVAEVLRKSFRSAALERLNHAGFIEFSSEKPLPVRERGAPKRREEKKKIGDEDAGQANSPVFVAPKDNGGQPLKCPECGISKPSERLLTAHLANVHDIRSTVEDEDW
jgi:hypothetical protein